MATPPLAESKVKKVKTLLGQAGLTHERIAQLCGVSTGTVGNIKRGMVQERSVEPSASQEPITHAQVRKMLSRGPMSEIEMADALDVSPARIRAAVSEMKALGAMISERHGKLDLDDSVNMAPGVQVVKVKPGVRRFGVLGDNHLCNKHSRLDVLSDAYDHFERLGITEVYNTGNWIDGEARFNKTELIVPPGLDNQIDYMVQVYPHRPGITTHLIAGDDHEGWYQQRERIEIGRYLQMSAERAGRNDLKYLGYGEADVRLQCGSGEAVMRVVHPGGGSSYAISYTDQKRVESYQGGEKPHVELAGHYHKFNYGFPRGVHTVQTGCTCDQTMFMRKKRLEAHVGFLVVEMEQDDRGAITRFSPTWFPRYDRGYYEKRF